MIVFSAEMAGVVFQEVSDCSLSDQKQLRCKLVTKYTGDGQADVMAIKHPAMAVWDPSDDFDDKKEVVLYLIHLVKVNERNLTQKERDENVERFEIQCRCTMRGALKEDEWDISGKEQDLNLNHGLVDVAHWCLKYELEKNYEYDLYSSNCKQFMEALCKAFKIKYDAKDWSDNVLFVAKAVKRSKVTDGCRQKLGC